MGLKSGQLGRTRTRSRRADWCSCRGNLGGDPATGTTFAEQGRQAFENLRVVLEAPGGGMDPVVNTTCLLGDISYFPERNALFAEYFAASPPARMAMQVPLPLGLLFSIGCVATEGD